MSIKLKPIAVIFNVRQAKCIKLTIKTLFFNPNYNSNLINYWSVTKRNTKMVPRGKSLKYILISVNSHVAPVIKNIIKIVLYNFVDDYKRKLSSNDWEKMRNLD